METPSAGNAPFTKNNLRRAVLTATKVLEIRKFYEAGNVTQGQLARDYGVSVIQIGRIVRGEVWQSLGPVAPTGIQLEASAERMLLLQKKIEAEGGVKELVAVKGSSWGEQHLTEAARERLRAYTEPAPMSEVERPSTTKRVPPPSPLDGGDGGLDETQGVGVKALERTLADDKAVQE